MRLFDGKHKKREKQRLKELYQQKAKEKLEKATQIINNPENSWILVVVSDEMGIETKNYSFEGLVVENIVSINPEKKNHIDAITHGLKYVFDKFYKIQNEIGISGKYVKEVNLPEDKTTTR
jgi:hypothetical protein